MGNARYVLTAQQDVHRHFAGFETNNRVKEKALFAITDETATAVNAIPNYPVDPTTDRNEFTSRLNGSENV